MSRTNSVRRRGSRRVVEDDPNRPKEHEEAVAIQQRMNDVMRDWRLNRFYLFLMSWVSLPIWFFFGWYIACCYVVLQICDRIYLALNFLRGRTRREFPGQTWEKLTPGDAAWSETKGYHNNYMIINGIMKVESLSFDRIKSVVLGKWISKYDRFSSVLVKSGFSYYFKALGQHFNPDDHVFRVGQGTIWDQEKLRSYMEEETAKPLDPGKPLWQIHVIENYKEGTNDACTVMFVRIHHVLADGIALVRLLLEVLADSHPKKEIADQTHKKKSQFGVSTTEWLIRGAILSPFYFIFHYISPPDRSNLHGPALSGKRTISWIHGLSMKDTLAMKETISKICGRKITLNDLLVGILGEAMLRYLRNHGCEKASENFPSQMKASVPVNLRPGNSKLEVNNKFAILFPELVLSLRNRYKVTGVGSIDNILSTHRHFDFLKHSGLPMAAQAGQPMSVVNFVTDTYSSKCSAVLSNVPGPQEKLTLDGAEVKNVMFWAPGRYNIGLALSVFTYTTEVHFGVTADMALVSDASLVTASIREEFNQTLADIKGTFPETFAEAERIASSKTS